ncbi:MAG: DUF1778 domain-containing protein, partial [Mesorhizobium sp.]
DFVREAAVRAAEDVLMETRLIRMSPEGFADFMAVLSGPPTPVPEIVELAKRPALVLMIFLLSGKIDECSANYNT